jgi:hypothetical protein
MFVQRCCTSSIVFRDARQGEDSLLTFRAPLYRLVMYGTCICLLSDTTLSRAGQIL